MKDSLSLKLIYKNKFKISTYKLEYSKPIEVIFYYLKLKIFH